MSVDSRIAFALKLLEGRIHLGAQGSRCACGPCRHWVVTVAKHVGVRREALEAALPKEADQERQPRRRPTRLPTRICENATVRPRGHRGQSPGMVVFLDRFHKE